MPDAASKMNIASLDDFLAYLHSRGFSVGVEEHLRVRHLFDKLENDPSAERLKWMLCPLFASNKSQQDKFYREFDNYVDRLVSKSGKDRPPPPPPPHPPGFRKLIITISAATAVIAGVIVIAFYLQQQPHPTVDGANAARSQNLQDQVNTGNSQTPVTPNIASTVNNAPENIENNALLNRPNKAAATRKNTHPVSPEPVNITRVEAPTATPIPPPTPSPAPAKIWNVSKPWTYYLAALALTAFTFLFYEWFLARRRKKILERQHSKKPPYVWFLRPEIKAPAIYTTPEFFNAARLMRKRQVDEFHRLNLPSTIAATIKAIGYPSLRYTFANKAPEYLVLINRVSVCDHQAKLFSELVRAFQKESVFVVHYFYEDPRICADESDQNRVRLVELQNKYPKHRLIILGDGSEMIEPITGELDDWTTIFQSWNERALLTPVPPSLWGIREITLSKNFLVLPGTTYGLSKLVGQMETTIRRPLSSWRADKAPAFSGKPDLNGTEPSELIVGLRLNLGEDVFQWLCACAVYPELDWNLTLYLGALPALGEKLVNEENLLKLTGLEWFRRGNIPDAMRWHLINALDPEKEKAVRAALIELLEKAAPPENLARTYAADDYELNLLSQRWLYKPNRKRLNELLRKLKALPRSQALRDSTLTLFLQSVPRRFLNLFFPQALRQNLFVKGVSTFGLNPLAKRLAALILMAAVLVAVPFVPAGSDADIQIDKPLQDVNSNSNTDGTNSNVPGGDSNNNTDQPPVPQLIMSFYADPVQIENGETAKLCWSLTDAQIKYISWGNGNVIEIKKDKGCVKVSPVSTTTYSLYAEQSDRNETASAVITVGKSSQLIKFFTADHYQIEAGESAELCWGLEDQVAYSLADPSGIIDKSAGSKENCLTVTPSVTTVYVLNTQSMQNQDAYQSKDVTIDVTSKCPPVKIVNCPTSTIASGQKLILTGRVNTGRPTEKPYTYFWEVSPTGTKAQESGDTSNLTIDASVDGNSIEPLTVTLRVEGLEKPGCANSDTCVFNVKPPGRAIDDVRLKVTFNKINDIPQNDSFNVRVEAVKSDGTVVQGLRVYYMTAGSLETGTSDGKTQAFPRLSSPTEIVLSKGGYFFWASLDSDSKQQTKQIFVDIKSTSLR
jgi:hypothetical protein